jgi:Na+/melibiose symporter-like transporter
MATYPPLWVMLCIQVAFAITTILMLWSVSIKAASLLGDHSEQGKIMGWMEGLRGVGVMSLAVFTMWVFSRFAPDDSNSLKAVIIIYSVVYILLGILCWFFVSDALSTATPRKKRKSVSAKRYSRRPAHQHHLVLQHGHFWRLYHLRHPQLLHQLSDGNVRYVAGGRELYGDCHQQNLPRHLRPAGRHYYHL